jgi:hypothetical protein
VAEEQENSIVDLKKFLGTPERPVSMQEMNEFWGRSPTRRSRSSGALRSSSKRGRGLQVRGRLALALSGFRSSLSCLKAEVV